MVAHRTLILWLTSLVLPLSAETFPLSGDHLAANEYVHWQQAEGLTQLKVKRFAGAQWQSKSSDRRDDAYSFNQPVYAVRAGRVIACWRNAPDNPKAGEYSSELGLNTPEADTRISQYGNHLWIAHEDGSQVLYAFLKEGSIPKALCPHDAELLNSAYASPTAAEMEGEFAVPEPSRATVSVGMEIGRIGQSGLVNEAQLGLRYQRGLKPLAFKFDKGLFSMAAEQESFLKWQPIEGQSFPLQQAFFWPVRTLVADLPYFKQPLADYERVKPWLTESGFWPRKRDVYSVAGEFFVNVTWRPATKPWVGYPLLSEQQHKQTQDTAFIEGYSLLEVDSTLVNGELKYQTLYVQDLAPVITKHAMNLAEFNKLRYQARKANYGAAAISVQYINQEPVITALFRPDVPMEQEYNPRLNVDNFARVYEQMAAKKWYPVYLNAYHSHLGNMLSVIFSPRAHTDRDEIDLDYGDLRDRLQDAREDGLITGMVSGYDNAEDKHEFAAYWQLPE
ncbi:MAG: hypothetical protein HWE13_00575 [Gammaproteobacteria bacterium]|nr:hypothetical protein [Gammaproteobacteria bacterium]